MTTAPTGTDFVQNAFELGCRAFATKPVDTDELVDVMKSLDLI